MSGSDCQSTEPWRISARIEDGILVEHWDVTEATGEQSKSGRPMFGNAFPVYSRAQTS